MMWITLLVMPLSVMAADRPEHLNLDAAASSIRYHGVASLHSFDADARSISGDAEVPPAAPASGFGGVKGKILIAVKDIDTHVSGRNTEMFKLLELPQYPTMTFALTAAEALSNKTDDGREIDNLADGEVKCALKGTLTVKGKPAPVEGRGRCLHTGNTWKVTGEAPVDMQKFEIKPPHVAFIGMDPVVVVKYDLTFRK